MTREEAIKVLNMVEAHGLADEAKRMAIEALSEPTEDVNKLQTPAEPNKSVKYKSNLLDIANGEVSVSDMAGDLVSRKILIGAIEKCGEEKIYPQALIQTINALPSAKPSLKAIKKQIDEHWYLDKDDLISREEAKERIRDKFKSLEDRLEINSVLNEVPSAVPQDNDWSEYSDRLWKLAYERGKADRPQGEWIRYKRCDAVGDEIYALMEAPNGKFFCNQCGKSAIKSDFCPHCGADMRKDADR